MTFDSLTWSVAEGEHENHLLLIRFREIPKTFPRARYPQRLNIFWKMSATDENGFPTRDEFKRMDLFEDRLLAAVEDDEHSILVGTLTCNGEREHIFHTADIPGFLDRLTNMPQEEERYPITIQKYDDPAWSYFESVIPKVN